jgi:hypothetical protein
MNEIKIKTVKNVHHFFYLHHAGPTFNVKLDKHFIWERGSRADANLQKTKKVKKFNYWETRTSGQRG